MKSSAATLSKSLTFKIAGSRGAMLLKNLPVTCSPETVSENLEIEIPMDVTEETKLI